MNTKRYLNTITLFALLLLPVWAMAQDITGFWGINEVKVGAEIMTPVAKWTRINKDGSFQMGNGWVQNSAGTWTYDKKSRAYHPKETHGTGIVDEAGAFTVSFEGDKMLWKRMEEGEQVVVILQRITQLPMSPGDQLVGVWDLARITKDGQEITPAFDPDNKYYLFMRWDRVFIERTTKNDRAHGLWHINGHKPEITLIRNEQSNENWRITVNGSELSLVGISEVNKGVEMVFARMDRFPE